MEEVTRTLDSRKSVDIIYLDFAKAFDKFPYQRLLKNLIHMVLGEFFYYGYNLGLQVEDRK